MDLLVHSGDEWGDYCSRPRALTYLRDWTSARCPVRLQEPGLFRVLPRDMVPRTPPHYGVQPIARLRELQR